MSSSDDFDDAFSGAINMLSANSDYAMAVDMKAKHNLSTFWGDSCFPGAMNCSGNGGPVEGEHGCLKLGGCWHLADGDWQAAVAAEGVKLQPLIANGTVVGIFVGDEMVCNGRCFRRW